MIGLWFVVLLFSHANTYNARASPIENAMETNPSQTSGEHLRPSTELEVSESDKLEKVMPVYPSGYKDVPLDDQLSKKIERNVGEKSQDNFSTTLKSQDTSSTKESAVSNPNPIHRFISKELENTAEGIKKKSRNLNNMKRFVRQPLNRNGPQYSEHMSPFASSYPTDSFEAERFSALLKQAERSKDSSSTHSYPTDSFEAERLSALLKQAERSKDSSSTHRYPTDSFEADRLSVQLQSAGTEDSSEIPNKAQQANAGGMYSSEIPDTNFAQRPQSSEQPSLPARPAIFSTELTPTYVALPTGNSTSLFTIKHTSIYEISSTGLADAIVDIITRITRKLEEGP